MHCKSLIYYIPEWEGMNNYDHFCSPQETVDQAEHSDLFQLQHVDTWKVPIFMFDFLVHQHVTNMVYRYIVSIHIDYRE